MLVYSFFCHLKGVVQIPINNAYKAFSGSQVVYFYSYFRSNSLVVTFYFPAVLFGHSRSGEYFIY